MPGPAGSRRAPLSHLVPGGEAGHCGPQGGPGHLAWSKGLPVQPCLPPQGPPPFLPQCYGLWDHEEDPLSKEPDGGHGKEEPEEEPALLGLQTEEGTGPREELGVAGATTEDDIQVEARDGPSEPHVELRPHDTKRIGLRFRRRRKESAEPRGPIGTCPCQLAITPAHPALTLQSPPRPGSNHTLSVQRMQPQGPTAGDAGRALCLVCWSGKWGDGSPLRGALGMVRS